ncbi:MAG: hypothetical protein ACREDA_04325 [Methylocella sp.]
MPAPTLRPVFLSLKPDALEHRFAAWIASLQDVVRGLIALAGKTRRGSFPDANRLLLALRYRPPHGLSHPRPRTVQTIARAQPTEGLR